MGPYQELANAIVLTGLGLDVLITGLRKEKNRHDG